MMRAGIRRAGIGAATLGVAAKAGVAITAGTAGISRVPTGGNITGRPIIIMADPIIGDVAVAGERRKARNSIRSRGLSKNCRRYRRLQGIDVVDGPGSHAIGELRVRDWAFGSAAKVYLREEPCGFLTRINTELASHKYVNTHCYVGMFNSRVAAGLLAST